MGQISETFQRGSVVCRNYTPWLHVTIHVRSRTYIRLRDLDVIAMG